MVKKFIPKALRGPFQSWSPIVNFIVISMILEQVIEKKIPKILKVSSCCMDLYEHEKLDLLHFDKGGKIYMRSKFCMILNSFQK